MVVGRLAGVPVTARGRSRRRNRSAWVLEGAMARAYATWATAAGLNTLSECVSAGRCPRLAAFYVLWSVSYVVFFSAATCGGNALRCLGDLAPNLGAGHRGRYQACVPVQRQPAPVTERARQPTAVPRQSMRIRQRDRTGCRLGRRIRQPIHALTLRVSVRRAAMPSADNERSYTCGVL